MPGLIGPVLGGFVIGAHGLDLIDAGNQTVPALGQLGLLYLMFVAGLELDLHVLGEYRRQQCCWGCSALRFPAPPAFWSVRARLVAARLVPARRAPGLAYVDRLPTLRDAGLSDNPAVASAVGATVLTDTLALVVLAVVAGSQGDSGSPVETLVKIGIGFAALSSAGCSCCHAWSIRRFAGGAAIPSPAT